MSFSILPEWVCFILTLIFVLVSHEVGFIFGMKRRKRPGGNPEAAAGAMSGTALGLLAFMLAFTFNGAASDYDNRKKMVLEDANAIRTVYQRSMTLPESERIRARAFLQEHLDVRLGLIQTRADIVRVIERTSAIQEEL